MSAGVRLTRGVHFFGGSPAFGPSSATSRLASSGVYKTLASENAYLPSQSALTRSIT